MYTILVDDKPIYAPNIANEGFAVLNPKIIMELNKSGSLEFTIPPNNKNKDIIQKLKSIVQAYDGNEEIFRGRVLHDDSDFYKRKAVYCEGELAFLLDSVQRKYDYQGTLDGLFTQYINNHNAQVDDDKKFVVGDITVTDKNNYVHYSSTQYPNTWEEINAKLIDTHGGYIRTRLENGVRYIDYIQDYTHVSDQVIEFGHNILELSEYISADDVFTILIPLGENRTSDSGEDLGRLTIESVNGGKDYIQDDDAIALFGRITKINTWDDVTDANNLLNKGKAFLSNGIQMSVTLTLKAVDLHLLNVNVERIHLGDYVRVISLPHKINKLFQCSKIELDLQNPQNSTFTFGMNFSSMTDKQVKTNKGAVDLETAVIVAQNTANQAMSVAEDADSGVQIIINRLPEDYVSEETFTAFQTEVRTKLSSVYHVKGSVANFDSLPTTGRTIGDVWNVLDTGANYVFTEDGWDKLSETIDLSDYALKEDIPTKTSDLTNDSDFVVTNDLPTKVSDLVNDSGFIDSESFQALVDRVTALENK